MSRIRTRHLDSLDNEQLMEISDQLAQFPNENAMNLDEMDGFFAALHCMPEMIMPSDFLPEVWGGGEPPKFDQEQNAKAFFAAVLEYWNTVGARLSDDDIFYPIIFEDEAPGCEWACGFLRGMQYCDEWMAFVDDENTGGPAVTIILCASENHPDPELRPFKEPITEEKRSELLTMLAVSVMKIYKHFSDDRKREAQLAKASGVIRRESPKIGRNAPCPCGSGKKYKKCCAKLTLVEH